MTQGDRYLNRELSWLDFDARVLALARDGWRPLLERAKFVAIFARNLDEFFQVRVANLQDQVEAGLGAVSIDGRSASEQLARIRERVVELTAEARDLVREELVPGLAGAGLAIASWDDLASEERARAEQRFERDVRPLLVPLSVDPVHPFPYLSGMALNVGALVRPRSGGRERFARVKVPPFVSRLWAVGPGRFVPLEQIIRAKLGELFPGDEILHTGLFRVTRDADLELRETESGDLVLEIEAGLRRRRRGSDAVRLEVSDDLHRALRETLAGELCLEPEEIYESSGLMDPGVLWELQKLERPDLKDPVWTPRPVPGLPAGAGDAEAMFSAIRRCDFLVHHPYESFEASVEGFLRAAADDPAVRVIMTTIYRTGGTASGIVRALERAASQGKQVAVLVELKARFDEEANIEQARALERAGAHVSYGVVGLKTHAKCALAVRQEADGLRRYCHVGTGNYNPETARLYEDVGLLTASAEMTRDVAELFSRLTSASGSRRYRRLLVAPESMRAGILERIEREGRAGDGRIVMKVNNLSDAEVIEALYAAAANGARIDLIVRCICCLRPGAEGDPERIRIRSVLGRFLEHSRIFRFGSRQRGIEYWIGSADLMGRNFDLRVEALAPIVDPALQGRLEQLLALYLHPDVDAWTLAPDGSWKRTGGRLDVQDVLQARARGDAAALAGVSALE